MLRTIAILTVAGLTMPLAAHALNERVWLTLGGGGGTYAMKVVNADIDASNAAFGLNLQHVKGGRSLGAAAGCETGAHWNFGLGFERLNASTKTSDASGATEWRFNANVWRVFAEYALRPVGRSTVFVGGAIGLVQENGKVIQSSPGSPTFEAPITGGDPCYEAYLGGNWWPRSDFALTANLGYRIAKVKDLQIGGLQFIQMNGEPMVLDFSGPTARLGIKVAAKPF